MHPAVEMTNLFILSGCWESNPVYTNPNRTYYRYTTARLWLYNTKPVDDTGLEPVTFRV